MRSFCLMLLLVTMAGCESRVSTSKAKIQKIPLSGLRERIKSYPWRRDNHEKQALLIKCHELSRGMDVQSVVALMGAPDGAKSIFKKTLWGGSDLGFVLSFETYIVEGLPNTNDESIELIFQPGGTLDEVEVVRGRLGQHSSTSEIERIVRTDFGGKKSRDTLTNRGAPDDERKKSK